MASLSYSLAKELQGSRVHFPDVVEVNELRKFLDGCTMNLSVNRPRKILTPRAASISSTSATSYQLSRLHNGPSNPGLTTRYDLKSAVSTTRAHSTSCSGVREENGASGIARSESLDVSDNDACLWECAGVIWKASSDARSFTRLSGRYRRRPSTDRPKSSTECQ